MTRAAVYNASVGIGTTMVGVGTGAAYGWPFGLIASGLLVIVLSLVATRVR